MYYQSCNAQIMVPREIADQRWATTTTKISRQLFSMWFLSKETNHWGFAAKNRREWWEVFVGTAESNMRMKNGWHTPLLWYSTSTTTPSEEAPEKIIVKCIFMCK